VKFSATLETLCHVPPRPATPLDEKSELEPIRDPDIADASVQMSLDSPFAGSRSPLLEEPQLIRSAEPYAGARSGPSSDVGQAAHPAEPGQRQVDDEGVRLEVGQEGGKAVAAIQKRGIGLIVLGASLTMAQWPPGGKSPSFTPSPPECRPARLSCA